MNLPLWEEDILSTKGDYKRLTPEQILEKIEKMKKGRLKIYIGAAPGVGKTFHMLRDAHDLKKKGIDLVVGLIETHGRQDTANEIKDLEIIPKKIVEYKGKYLDECDVEAILKRNPDVVIIDELAHSNVPGSKNQKRYQDVFEILEAGIHVWTAMNIQHIESVRDIVKNITGIQVNERVPDSILQQADEVEVIDVSPETLRDRIKEGKIYKKDKIDQSLNHFFRRGNLVALRELVLREVADGLDAHLDQVRIEDGFEEEPTGVHEKILVCVNYQTTAEKLIRRGWRIASRLHADLTVLHVNRQPEKRLSPTDQQCIQEWRRLTNQFQAIFLYQQSISTHVADTIVKVVQEQRITQIIMGMSARTRWEEIMKGSIIQVIMRRCPYVDVLVVSDRT